MTTSNTFTFEVNRDAIIAAALRKLGVIGEGIAPNSTQYTTGAEALNSLVTLLATEGMPLWVQNVSSVTLVAATKSYTISNALKILQVFRKTTSSGSQVDLTELSKYDFNLLNSTTTGTPVSFYVDHNIDSPAVVVWPIPTAAIAATDTLEVVYQKEFDQFTVTADTPAFPSYWSDALIYNLAARLAPEYGLPLEDRRVLMAEASSFKDLALDFGYDATSLFVQPGGRY